MRIIDISQKIYPGMEVYPGDPHFYSQLVSGFEQGDVCEVSEIRMGTHCGTHIDAPLHMIPQGPSIDEVPLEAFVGPCRVLTVRSSEITREMLSGQEIRKGERILFRTDPDGRYSGNVFSNPVGLSVEAAAHLANRGVCMVGIDSPSIENIEKTGGEVHRVLLGAGIAILEGLRLDHIGGASFLLCALPLALTGENGSPCRAVLIEE